MNEEAIIDYHLKGLIRLVASIFSLVGLVTGGPVLSSISDDVRRQVLRILQPAESSLRRLIYMRARGLVVSPAAKRKPPNHPIPKGDGTSDHIPAFTLFDPRKWFKELANQHRLLRGPGPRISSFDERRPAIEPPAPKTANAANLSKRLLALHKALEDIPAQAKRLARLQAKRRAAGEILRRIMPLRPGFPPGYRKRITHIVDEILYELDILARREPRPSG